MSTENYGPGGVVGHADGHCTVWGPPHAGEQLITSQGEVYQWAVESASWLPTGERIDMAGMMSRLSAHVRGDDAP